MNDREKRAKILWILQKENLTQTWLINQLEKRGIPASKANVSDILRGVRRGDVADSVIETSLELLEDYVKWSEKPSLLQ